MRVKIVLLVVGSLLFSLLVLEGAVRLSEEDGKFLGTPLRLSLDLDPVRVKGFHYLQEDRRRGWTIRPNGRSPTYVPNKKYSYFYQANGEGFRADRDASPDPDRLRIALFGDSFVHADEVDFEDSWGRILEREQFEGVEVLNFAVPGFGTDQSYLHYRILGKRFHPHVVVIGLTVENIARNVNLLRLMYQPESGIPYSKPRFVLDGENLRLVNYPTTPHDELIRLGGRLGDWRYSRFDYFYNPWIHNDWPVDRFHLVRFLKFRVASRLDCFNRKRDLENLYDPKGEPFRVTVAVIDRFYREVQKAGAEPMVVVLPNADNILDRGYLIEFLRTLGEKKIRTLNLTDTFKELRHQYWGPSQIFWAGNGHYTPWANAVVAQQVGQYLVREVLPSMQTALRNLPSVRPKKCWDLVQQTHLIAALDRFWAEWAGKDSPDDFPVYWEDRFQSLNKPVPFPDALDLLMKNWGWSVPTESNARWVRAVFRAVYDRPPTEDEFWYWEKFWKTKKLSAKEVLNGILSPPNEFYVMWMTDAFASNPPVTGENPQVSRRELGGLFERNFLKEIAAQRPTYADEEISLFVEKVYKTLLDRKPNWDEIAIWRDSIKNQGMKYADVVSELMRSREFRDRYRPRI